MKECSLGFKLSHIVCSAFGNGLLILSVVCLISFSSAFGAEVGSAAERPNIVLIFADEMPPEYIGAYGGEWATPNLDRIAERGMRFTRAYASAPMCTPSRFAVLTGLYPGRCQSENFLKEYPPGEPYSIGWNTRLLGDQSTVADVLGEAGYVTGMVGKWHLGPMIRPEPFPDGISLDSDEADRILETRQAEYAAMIREMGGFDQATSIVWGNFDHAPLPEILQYHNLPWMTHGAVRFIREHANGVAPFFLYVAPTSVHGPPHQDSLSKNPVFTPGGRIDEVRHFADYRAALRNELEGLPVWNQHQRAGVRELDELVGEILDTLEAEDIAENTLVVFMPDHGIEPGKSAIYERGFFVPLMMCCPAHIPPNSLSESLVQSVDLPATFTSLGGVDGTFRTDGVDLTPLWQNEHPEVRQVVYLESGYFRAVSDGYRKLALLRWPMEIEDRIRSGGMEVLTAFGRKQGHGLIAANSYPAYFAPDQFYDLVEDPFELDNRIDDPRYGAALGFLRGELEARLQSFDHPYPIDRTGIFHTEEYSELAQRTRAVDLSSIWWIRRDHGSIDWPPAQF